MATRYCAGVNRNDTREHPKFSNGNTNPNFGKDYGTASFDDIIALAAAPKNVPKADAPWVIGSTFHKSTARKHARQRSDGSYGLFSVDAEGSDASMAQMVAAARAALGAGVKFLIHPTKGSMSPFDGKGNPRTPTRRWRCQFEVTPLVPGSVSSYLSDAVAQAFEALGVECDTSAERHGQIMYLANSNEYHPWEYYVEPGGPLLLGYQDDAGWHRHALANKAWDLKEAWDNSPEAARVGKGIRNPTSPLGLVVAHYDIEVVLAAAGYLRNPRNPEEWQSPYSLSKGSYGVHVNPDGSWTSQHAGDKGKLGRWSHASKVMYGDVCDILEHFWWGEGTAVKVGIQIPYGFKPPGVPDSGTPAAAKAAFDEMVAHGQALWERIQANGKEERDYAALRVRCL